MRVQGRAQEVLSFVNGYEVKTVGDFMFKY